MKLSQLLKYSQEESGRFISGSKSAEENYLKFHFKRFKELFSLIKQIAPGKLLDIGTTPFTLFLAENTSHQIYAYDYNDLQEERCRRHRIIFNSGDLTKSDIPYDKNQFDLIVFAEVFEHLHADPISILEKLYKIAAPDGILILGTPNLASLLNRVKLLLNKPILEYPTWGDEVHGHDRLYVRSELETYLRKAGFSIQKTSYSSSIDFCSLPEDSKIKVLFRKLFKYSSLPFRLIFPSFNGTIIITAKKQTTNDL